jgi:hypothetical protein
MELGAVAIQRSLNRAASNRRDPRIGFQRKIQATLTRRDVPIRLIRSVAEQQREQGFNYAA